MISCFTNENKKSERKIQKYKNVSTEKIQLIQLVLLIQPIVLSHYLIQELV